MMKKLLLVLLVLFAMFSFASCGEKTDMENEIKNEKKESPSSLRTEDISEGIEDSGGSYSYSYDFDFDGDEEDIEIEFSGSEEAWLREMEISVGKYSASMQVEGARIEAVYVCDIDADDGIRDLAVITNEMSDDPRVRILKYDENLSKYNFVHNESWSDGNPYDYKWLGYAVNLYFNVNDNDTITMEEQTSSAGMWSVYKTYYRDENGYFTEEKPEYYEILPDFMEDNYDYNRMTGKEKEMWEDGYIKAYVDYTSNGFAINEGEYFKVLYDDGESRVYVEKENGESDWIDISYNIPDRDALNPYFFHVAG